MADTPTPAPAAAGDSVAPMSEDQILAQLARYGDDGEHDETDSPAADEAQADIEPDEQPDTPEPEGEEGEGDEPGEDDEGEGPEDDASEPEQKEAPDKAADEDTKMVRLRDRTEVSLGDLKKGYDKAREFDRVLPQIQQEHQRFQQEKQQFTAQQQQFQAYASHVAQTALNFLPPEPDVALMDENSGKYDPIAFMQAQHRRQAAVADFNQKFQGIAQATAAATQQAQQEQAQRIQTVRQQAAQQFFAARPDLQPKEKAEEYFRDFHAVADAVGYSREERAKVEDPRLYEMARLAAIGLKAMKAGEQQKVVTEQRKSIAAKKVAAAPPVTPPAARQTAASRDARAMQGSVDRLRKNPSSTQAALDALAQFE